jgi:polar amino acid transport system substrate-binding protein
VRCFSKVVFSSAIIVGLAVISGCGSASKPALNTQATANASVHENATLHADLPAAIKTRGTLIMATDPTIGAPFASFASNNTTIVGMNVDMAQAIGKVLGVKIRVANTPFGTFIPGLQAGRYDFSVSVMLDTKIREKVVTFIDYIKDGSGFLVQASNPRTHLTLADMCGMKVAAISGSAEQLALTHQSVTCKKDGKKPVQLSVFAENSQGILALVSGRLSVWAGDSDQDSWLKQQNNGQLKVSGPAWEVAIDGIAVPKGSPLIPIIQKAVQELMNNGTYGKILAKYDLQPWALKAATINHAQY